MCHLTGEGGRASNPEGPSPNSSSFAAGLSLGFTTAAQLKASSIAQSIAHAHVAPAATSPRVALPSRHAGMQVTANATPLPPQQEARASPSSSPRSLDLMLGLEHPLLQSTSMQGSASATRVQGSASLTAASHATRAQDPRPGDEQRTACVRSLANGFGSGGQHSPLRRCELPGVAPPVPSFRSAPNAGLAPCLPRGIAPSRGVASRLSMSRSSFSGDSFGQHGDGEPVLNSAVDDWLTAGAPKRKRSPPSPAGQRSMFQPSKPAPLTFLGQR